MYKFLIHNDNWRIYFLLRNVYKFLIYNNNRFIYPPPKKGYINFQLIRIIDLFIFYLEDV